MDELKQIILDSIESQKRFHKRFIDLMYWWEDDIPAGIIADKSLTHDERI